jgi:hypothetical protein
LRTHLDRLFSQIVTESGSDITGHKFINLYKEGLFDLDTGEFDEDKQKESVIRLLCHMMVQQISRQGLIETIENLADLYKFYQAKSETKLLKKVINKEEAFFLDTVTRPNFILEIDEE